LNLHRLDLSGGTLAVREWDGAGTPLLVWHALGQAASGAFAGVMATRLAAHGLHPYAIDGPGFGESAALPTAEYTVPRMADILLEAADALQLERPILLGHSWGATIVLEAARRDPGRWAGVALLDAGHADFADWPTAKPAATVEELIDAARPADDVAVSWSELESEVEAAYPGQEWMLDFFRAGTHVEPDGRVRAIAPAEVRGAAFHGLIRARSSLAWPVLQAAGTPGLLLLATVPEETDKTNRLFVPAFRDAWPDAEVFHVEGATHSLFTELRETLGDVIGEWAERMEIA
jgi:pimeloyl-ACP methyl ester carboxylesterase